MNYKPLVKSIVSELSKSEGKFDLTVRSSSSPGTWPLGLERLTLRCICDFVLMLPTHDLPTSLSCGESQAGTQDPQQCSEKLDSVL